MNCNYSLSNTGTACTPLIQAAKKFIAVPIFDTTGARNRITIASIPNQAAMQALVDQANESKRWYPIPEVKNVEAVRAENIVESFNDGSQVFIQQGSKTVTAIIVEKNAPARLLKALNSFRNIEFGIYVLDKDNNLVGMRNTDGYLDPIRIDASSWSPRFMDSTDTTAQKIMLNFNWHVNEKDENLDMIASTEFAAGTSIIDLEGLVDIYATVSNISTTGARIYLYAKFGTQTNPFEDEGRVAADFISSDTLATSKIYNQTDAADVSITGVTESSPGVYDLTWAAQTSADVLIPFLTFSGRDYTNVKSSTITIP